MSKNVETKPETGVEGENTQMTETKKSIIDRGYEKYCARREAKAAKKAERDAKKAEKKAAKEENKKEIPVAAKITAGVALAAAIGAAVAQTMRTKANQDDDVMLEDDEIREESSETETVETTEEQN